MKSSEYDPIEDEREELKQMVAWDRKRKNILAAHPDCRDPDHPGCDKCFEYEDDVEY